MRQQSFFSIVLTYHSKVDKGDRIISVKILSDFLFAIEQAGSFIRTTGKDITQYISLHEINQSNLHKAELPKLHV